MSARPSRAPGVSKFHGVSWNKALQLWQVRVNVGTTQFTVGRFAFDREEDAARAFDNAAWFLQDLRKHWPKLNFPDVRPEAYIILPKVLEIRAVAQLICGFPILPAPLGGFVPPTLEEMWAAVPAKYN
jgi:hypothetical protein